MKVVWRGTGESQLSLLAYQGKGEMHKAGRRVVLVLCLWLLLAALMCLEFSCSHLWRWRQWALLMVHPELCGLPIPILTKRF